MAHGGVGMRRIFEGKRVLVTGGTGSIGREIVKQLLSYEPEVIRIYSRNETNQFMFQQQLGERRDVRFLLGDVRDKERLRRACDYIDIIFHSAALKHVPFCEYNPFEAVKTNVLGTQNLIDVALDQEVERVISINTDKSVSPINTMGATKLLSEKLITAANKYKGRRRTIFATVRFGNVVGSSGSVLPLFVEQIKRGGPVTITDPAMARFVMTIPEAVRLVLKAASKAQGGEVFILKMPALKIIDMAEALCEELGDGKAGDVEFKYIGRRPGEKIEEELLTAEERPYTREEDDMFIFDPFGDVIDEERISFATANIKLMTKDEIKAYLKDNGLI
jgi:UDP-N-acetylglucosamine 4,6-dehydratase